MANIQGSGKGDKTADIDVKRVPLALNVGDDHGQVLRARVARVKAFDDVGLKAELAQQTV